MKNYESPIAHAVRLQISCCLYPQIPTQENLWGDSAASGRDFSRAGEAEGKSHLGGSTPRAAESGLVGQEGPIVGQPPSGGS